MNPTVWYKYVIFITACVCLAACERDRSGRVEGICTLEGEDNHEGIQLIIPGTQFRAITDAEGKFFIQDIPGGEYTWWWKAAGMKANGFHLKSLHVRRLRWTQSPGSGS